MTSPTELDGVVVAIIATTSDDPVSLGIPLLEAGASVLFCVIWSPFFNPPDDDDMSALIRPCTAYPRQTYLLTAADGDIFYDLFSEPEGPSRFVHWVRRAFGRLDAVIVGFETGLADEVAGPLTRQLRRSGGEVILVEGHASAADQIVLRFGDATPGPGVPVVLRWRTGKVRRAARGLGAVARALIRAGVMYRPTTADVRRLAAQRRREGDPIAGLQWTVAGHGDHDHGGCAFVTEASLQTAGPITTLSYGSTVTPLDPLGLDGVIVADHNGVAQIEQALDDDVAVAVRVGTLSDSFDTDEPYEEVGQWRPTLHGDSLDVVVGDPWIVIVDRGGSTIQLEGAPMWHIDHAMLDGEMVGMRMWCDRARTVAADPSR